MKTPVQRFLMAILSVVLINGPAVAQNQTPGERQGAFTLIGDNGEENTVELSGEITPFAINDFLNVTRNREIEFLLLNSPGGDLDAGIAIAEIVRDRNIQTVVQDTAECASACSIIFLAGSQRMLEGRLGVHQFRSVAGSLQPESETQAVTARVIEVLNSFGTPNVIAEQMLATRPECMYWFNSDNNELFRRRTDGESELIVTSALRTGVEECGAAAPSSGGGGCPAWQNPGVAVNTVDGAMLQTTQTYNVIAGGDQILANCNLGLNANGYVISNPDFEFQIDGLEAYQRLNLRVNGACDTVLLVNDANGTWHFNDDSSGLDPAIDIMNAPSGVYDVWVGTYGPNTCEAVLTMETSNTDVSATSSCPAWENPGAVVNAVNGAMLQTTQSYNTTAGGDQTLARCSNLGIAGTGYTSSNPNFEFQIDGLESYQRLALRVDSGGACDPVLLVNDANGTWHFNDDSSGLDPAIDIMNAPSGVYDIWVGTYGGDACEVTLTMETTN